MLKVFNTIVGVFLFNISNNCITFMWINGECFHKEEIVVSINITDISVYLATSTSFGASQTNYITNCTDLDIYRFKILNTIDCRCKKNATNNRKKKILCKDGYYALFFFCLFISHLQ